MIKLEDGKTIISYNNYFTDPLNINPTEETTDEKILGLNANHMMCRESKERLNGGLKNPIATLENERSTRLNAWAKFRGYTYHPSIEVWINENQDLKTPKDFEDELARDKISEENEEAVSDFYHFDITDVSGFQNFDNGFAAVDFSFNEDLQFTSKTNSISSTCTTTTSSSSSVLRTRQPTSIFPSIHDEMEGLENATMGFEFDPTSGNWINHYGITLTSEELSFNIEENKNQQKQAAHLNIKQFVKEAFPIREQQEKNEARIAKEMAQGLGCSFAYPQTEFLPISVKLENLDLYHQQIKAKYHKEAPLLIKAGKLCGYVYRNQMDYWEHYQSGKILDSDQLLRKYGIKSKTHLKKMGEY